MLNSFRELLAGLSSSNAALIGTWVAALLTLAVFSYLVGDNPIFRLAEHLFIGVSAGYASALTWNAILWPRLQLLLRDPASYWQYGIFFVLGLMLLSCGSRSLGFLGNLPLGLLFGTGAALALGGALAGTLVPQLYASVLSVSPADYGGGSIGLALAIDALLLIVGTIAVLVAFHFTVPRAGRLGSLWKKALEAVGGLGRALIMVTFGAVFAGAALTFFTVLMSRIEFLVSVASSALRNVGLGL